MPKKGLLDFTPDTNLLPRAYVVAKIEDVHIDETRSGKKRYNAECVIREPAALRGRHCYPSFVVGTDDDPGAQEPETWQQSGFCRSVKQFVRCAGSTSSDPDEAWQEVRGRLIGIFLNQRTRRDTGELDQSFSFFKPGDRDPEVFDDRPAKAAKASDDAKSSKSAKASGANKGKSKPKYIPDEEEDEEEEEDYDEDYDEDEDEDEDDE